MSNTLHEGFTRTLLGARWKAIRTATRVWNENHIGSMGTVARVGLRRGKEPTLLSPDRYYWSIEEQPKAREEYAAQIALRPDLADPRIHQEQLEARTGIEHKLILHKRKRVSLLSDIKNFLFM